MRLLTADIAVLLPHALLAAGIVAALLLAAFARRDGAVALAALASFAAAGLALAATLPRLEAPVTGLLLVDRASSLVSGLVLFASLCITVLGHAYFRGRGIRSREFTLLLMVASLGALVLAASNHFASLFLGVELMGIPLAAMAAYSRSDHRSIEAGFKYIVLAGASSAILLFGIALLYADAGTLGFDGLLERLARPSGRSALFPAGAALLIAGMGFKLAIVPFHVWAPDIYEGAPAPAVIFSAAVSKAAVIMALLRVFPPGAADLDRFFFALLALMAVASMTLGNLLALRQRNVKRLLAYSSIAHNGYLLIAFLAAGPLAAEAVLLYVVASVFTYLAAFGAVTLLSGPAGDAEDLDDYAGLSWRRPWVAAAFLIAVLSLLGLPLTAGFIAKFALVAAGLESARLALVLALALNTALAAAYYIRIIMTLYLGPREIHGAAMGHTAHRVPAIGIAVLSVQAALVLAVGVAPQFALRLIRAALW